MKDLNKKLDKISRLMHKRTGYSLIHIVLEAKYNMPEYYHDFFIFNSDEWQFFIELIGEACK